MARSARVATASLKRAARHFLEITAANEIDVVAKVPEMMRMHRADLALFHRIGGRLSAATQDAVKAALRS